MTESNSFNIDYYSTYARASFFHKRGSNPCVHNFWVRYIRKFRKNGELLEVGCGEGYFLNKISRYFMTWGIDINKDGIDIAKRIATKANLKVSNAAHLPFDENLFDVVVAFDVIEHMPNPELFFKEAFRVLKNDGILIIRTPNPLSFGAKVKGNLWHGQRDKTHISIRPPRDWKTSIIDSKFSVIEEGTDTLWDVPYVKIMPKFFQKLVFIGSHLLANLFFKGFFPWTVGENWVCIAKKP